jgi:histidine ammonia-lyase
MSKTHFYINHEDVKLLSLEPLMEDEYHVSLSQESIQEMQAGRDFLDSYLQADEKVVYGINTGFGSLCNTRISKSELQKLQENLVMSHACGMGEHVPHSIVRLMLFLKAKGLSKKYSGVNPPTVQRLVDQLNANLLPEVFTQGSLGASGDLAPLAHLSLPLIGKGKLLFKGIYQATEDVLPHAGWVKLALKSKEGLALLNGTQFMTAYGTWCLIRSRALLDWADAIAAISLEAFDGRYEPFDDLLHAVRPHPGQRATAAKIRDLLHGSEIGKREKTAVQDPYSFRCVPQVHGASKDVFDYVMGVFEREINSVTDNPILFPEEEKILSGGNFHGQPLAISLDMLSIAMAEIANISERRTYQLISGSRGLPNFLVKDAGLNSGFMIPQYTAASIVGMNKVLCHPASVDSIVSSNGQEDHISNGANAAFKCYRVIKNVQRVLAIELMNAVQALDLREGWKSSPAIEKIRSLYRKEVAMLSSDRELEPDLANSMEFLEFNKVAEIVR